MSRHASASEVFSTWSRSATGVLPNMGPGWARLSSTAAICGSAKAGRAFSGTTAATVAWRRWRPTQTSNRAACGLSAVSCPSQPCSRASAAAWSGVSPERPVRSAQVCRASVLVVSVWIAIMSLRPSFGFSASRAWISSMRERSTHS